MYDVGSLEILHNPHNNLISKKTFKYCVMNIVEHLNQFLSNSDRNCVDSMFTNPLHHYRLGYDSCHGDWNNSSDSRMLVCILFSFTHFNPFSPVDAF